MMTLKDLLAKVNTTNDVLYTNFELGAGGKILDPNGRLICTMNLKDLTLSEAFAYAAHFMASIDLADHLRALIAQEGEA